MYKTIDEVIEGATGQIIEEASIKSKVLHLRPEELDVEDSKAFLGWWLRQDEAYASHLEKFLNQDSIKAWGFPFNVAGFALVTYNMMTGKAWITVKNKKKVKIASAEDLVYLGASGSDKRLKRLGESIGAYNTTQSLKTNLRVVYSKLVNKIAEYEKCIEYFGGIVAYYSARKEPLLSRGTESNAPRTENANLYLGKTMQEWVNQHWGRGCFSCCSFNLEKNQGDAIRIKYIPGSEELELNKVVGKLRGMVSSIKVSIKETIPKNVSDYSKYSIINVYASAADLNAKIITLSSTGDIKGSRVAQYSRDFLDAFVNRLTQPEGNYK